MGCKFSKCPGYATVNDHVKGAENIEGAAKEEEEEKETSQKVFVARRKINDSVSNQTLYVASRLFGSSFSRKYKLED
jgi:hypothetical protein